MKQTNKVALEALVQEEGVTRVLEGLAEHCDRMADMMVGATGEGFAPLEMELRKWSRKIWTILKER
jgi:flagellar biosynthesis regulator FlaF